MLLSYLGTILCASICAAARPKNAILLSQVQSLTLKGNNAQTTHRRVSSIPQLKCISSKAICKLYDVDVMRCSNQGSSYGGEDVEWSCSASLPEELKLGGTEVICEGYASPDDPYVLKGSCGVEYRLVLTSKGEKRYPEIANPTGGWFSDGDGGTDMSAWIFTVIFVAVLVTILYSACCGNRDPRQPRARQNFGRRGGGGGGGGGGDDGGWGPGWDTPTDPPPPYPGSKSRSTQQQGWTPGFWSGLAGGAAAGYAAGNRGNRDNGQRRDRGSGWGAGSSSRTFGSSSASSSSSAQHESTGFGSTSRR